ncbi:hypothetical protein Focb16_v012835 [Fusarium oxysporum f. sp. cubense]|uniref:Uncharacterized protein n=1 Tax=Fusarium oxysporum f. sp. cubense TaxID=61366 RepID=A0A559LEQ6_FUSOC|nr:hypothetical protein Focb16_v012835 [Fusarium oxysporum f. sp. cubense]
MFSSLTSTVEVPKQQPCLMGASHFIVALPTNRKYPVYASTQKNASNDAVNDADVAEARGAAEGNGENGNRKPGKGKREKKKDQNTERDLEFSFS